MMKTVFYYFTFLTAVCSFSQTKVGTVTFNDIDTFGETELMLNGAGAREKLYAMALYLDFEVNGPEDGIKVAKKDEDMAITIKSARAMNQKDLNDFVRNGIEVATNGNGYKYEVQIAKLLSILPSEIKKFDILRFLYKKGGELSVFKNRTLLGSINDKEFKEAFFKSWLGENPVDYDLKEKLLAAYEPDPILGKWRMIDKKTGIARSIVQVYIIDKKVFGTIEEMMRESERDDVCFECQGEDKNKKIEGLTVIKGLQKGEEKYEGGTFTDIKTGAVSDCQIWTDEERPGILFVKYKGSKGVHEWRKIKEKK